MTQSLGGSGGLEQVDLSGDLQTHDPSLIAEAGTYYLFSTGTGLPIKTSPDSRTWQSAGRVFEELPVWIPDLLPDVTDLWAPDISFFNGTHHLYYAASTFGSGRSCIGHATKSSLADTNESWTDLGAVICSDIDSEVSWDAIDPNAFEDPEGQRWLVFGSFGSGIKMIPLQDDGSRSGDAMRSLAQRPDEIAVQAANLLYREPYFYLFSTFGQCCQGVSSTTKIMVGRSTSVLGPYTDRSGMPLMEGGGTLLLEGNQRWRAVGANAVFRENGRFYNVYHGYDANAAGVATLRIAEMKWNDAAWPVSAGP